MPHGKFLMFEIFIWDTFLLYAAFLAGQDVVPLPKKCLIPGKITSSMALLANNIDFRRIPFLLRVLSHWQEKASG